MTQSRSFLAEAIGTFWLVLGGCGSAILSTGYVEIGIGLLGVSLAFGLSVVTGAYALGHISGAHFNPAITVGLATAGKFPYRQVIPYILAQLLGAILASVFLYLIASGQPGFTLDSGFSTNGYGTASPGGYSLGSVLLTEFILTSLFVFLILEVTSRESVHGFAPLTIGLTLTVIHLISIPISNTSVNPARSTGPALISGGIAITQLWAFWLAPLAGGALMGSLHRLLRRKSGLKSEMTSIEAEERPLKKAASQ